MQLDLEFYRGKRVFVTGHTGFKGAWLCKILIEADAIVTGYALAAPNEISLYKLAKLEDKMVSVEGDIRDYDKLKCAFNKAQPEIVFHLAAQPIVRDSYKMPAYTFETNIMGTVNVLECIRNTDCVKSFINVTTDKVYKNKEFIWGYREYEELGGYDPYSNSKSCSELVTQSYKNCFFDTFERKVAISTVRAGNVIGGGDWANDRIIPDCVRAAEKGQIIGVRNPYSVRPYQHVLEPLMVYLMIAQKQYEDIRFAGNYNVGPDECDCVTTGKLVDMFCKEWGDVRWESQSELNAPHEANFLKLDCNRLKSVFDWKPRWHVEDCIRLICGFNKVRLKGGAVSDEMNREIKEFLEV